MDRFCSGFSPRHPYWASSPDCPLRRTSTKTSVTHVSPPSFLEGVFLVVHVLDTYFCRVHQSYHLVVCVPELPPLNLHLNSDPSVPGLVVPELTVRLFPLNSDIRYLSRTS